MCGGLPDKPYYQRLDTLGTSDYIKPNQRRVEQLAARRAHNPEVAGSSPAPAKKNLTM